MRRRRKPAYMSECFESRKVQRNSQRGGRERERRERETIIPVNVPAQTEPLLGYASRYYRYVASRGERHRRKRQKERDREIRRSGRQVYRESARAENITAAALHTDPRCRPSHNVCSAALYAPGAGSYIVRVSRGTSAGVSACIPRACTVCIHDKQFSLCLSLGYGG